MWQQFWFDFFFCLQYYINFLQYTSGSVAILQECIMGYETRESTDGSSKESLLDLQWLRSPQPDDKEFIIKKEPLLKSAATCEQHL